MIAIFTFILLLAPVQSQSAITVAQKDEFIRLLRSLPTKGEFYTDESVQKATVYVPVLFALTEKDLEQLDIYPFAAISSGLCGHAEIRSYGTLHFKEIQHPELKILWGVILFDRGPSSVEVSDFLRSALKSEEQTKILREIVGPKFADFKARLLSP